MNDPAPLPGVVLRKVTLRLVPFLCLLYFFNLLDRANVGFARLQMKNSLSIENWQIDLGIGLFYFGYLLFEVPSNLILRRVGARIWIARIMVCWGLVTCATLTVTGPWSFYLIRILLGVAEAGFFPGIVLYLTYWFPARERVRVIALFMAANTIAGFVGNPLNGAIMQYMDNVAGLRAWQWLFLLDGIPTVLLGLTVLWLLTDCPEQASWLSPEERGWLVERMGQEERHRQQRHGADLLASLIDGRVWLLICLYFTVAVGSNASAAYLPTLIKDAFTGWSDSRIGLLAALPSVCAVVSMTALGARSDRTGERRKHLAFAAFLAAAGWSLAALSPSPWVFLAGLCLAQAGMMSMLPIFWAMPTSFLSGAAAAGGIALINSMGNLGGLTGPSILGQAREIAARASPPGSGGLLGSLIPGQFGLWSMAGMLFVGGLLALVARHDSTLDRGLPVETPSEPKLTPELAPNAETGILKPSDEVVTH